MHISQLLTADEWSAPADHSPLPANSPRDLEHRVISGPARDSESHRARRRDALAVVARAALEALADEAPTP
ncbi:hypothetical protein HMPREF1624_01116 [Sporothrix schenckii ATCC 58251]|uniref:Uncharacterized protein n=1 Tax=Sporothrix schenckii (strain ATCC 58251 / de Perez 2211183) TaxID=1391915 RepID=U7Q4J2_SPOS1|nr:hypothetical protein HMPREF1624_01116 [Sporothrix schenckii ATCC 58251]